MSSGKRKLSFLGFGTGVEGGAAADQDLVHLDDEMEKVFSRSEPERLDVARLTAGSEPYKDHEGWRGLVSQPSDSDLSPGSAASQASAPHGRRGVMSSESEPQVSERTASLPDSPTGGSPSDKHVQFDADKVGAAAPADVTPPDDPAAADEERKLKRKTRHHHQQKGRKYSLQEDSRSGPRRVSVQPEDETLDEVDLEQLDSHRSDDPRALRRSKIHPKGSTVHVGRKETGDKLQNILPTGTYKKMYDHSPHSVFVQLDELLSDGGVEQEWKETARWIKYEEDVEEGSDRWGRPHVASLSFHSLLNLRRCLETGVVLLDLDEKDLPGVAYRVVEKMVEEQLIEEDDKPVVMRSLLLRHRHVHEHDRGFRFSISGRKHSSYTSLQSLWVEEGGRQVRCSVCSANATCRRHSAHVINLSDHQRHHRNSTALPLESLIKNGSSGDVKTKLGHVTSEPTHRIDMKEEVYTASQEDLKKSQNEAIMKRIPEDAQATTVLVGAVGFLDQPTIAFVRLAQGILMPSITEVPIPVRFMFILLGPTNADLDYHEVGRSISTLMSNPAFHKIAYKADDRRDLLSAINDFLDDSIVLPPGDWQRGALLPFDELKAKSDMIKRRKHDALQRKQAAAAAAGLILPLVTIDEQKKALLAADGIPPQKPDQLSKTGKPFGGVIRDVKRRFPYYLSDVTDGLNMQCIAAAVFMYFAAVSSAIAFGGMMSEKTEGRMGISETLVFTCVGGVLFALMGGQPLMNIGTTGPLLLFDASLYSFCKSNGLDFLAARMYMGVWIMLIALVVAFFEGSVHVKKFTRFTEDVFASLISLIFLAEPITKIIGYYAAHPLLALGEYCGQNYTTVPASGVNGTAVPVDPSTIAQPNTALFCTVLTLGTFAIAYYLRIFRNGKFLGRGVRRALGDFGVPIALVLMVLLANMVPQTYTEKLIVPDGLTPTYPGRPWLVVMTEGVTTFPIWAIFAMSLAGMMVFIITFMETHIAELIIDKPERNLKKGSGFHMDIVIVSFINMICGMGGAPWQCVATVRSVSHVSALTVMSTTHAPGDKPFIVQVREQRVTGLLVAILVGASVAMSGLLRRVPMSALFGVFLYMAISSMNGIQLFERLILLLKPVKHHPQVPYVRRVQTWRMHLFTLIQLSGLVVLYVVKSSVISLAFPFFLIMMVPLRMLLGRFFTPLELRALDGKQPELDMADEPDFYEEATLPA